MKKGLIIIILFSLCFSAFLLIEGITDRKRVAAMEELQNINLETAEIDDVTMFKLRDLTEIYDWTLAYLSRERAVIINNGVNIFKLPIGQKEVAGEQLKAAPLIKEGRTYIDAKMLKTILEEMEEIVPDIVTNLRVEDSVVQPGQDLKAVISLYNISERDLNLKYSSGQLYDLFLYKNEKEIWRWSADRMFTMALISKDLEPTAQLEYEEKVVIADDLSEGEYMLTGIIATEKPLKLNEINLEVVKNK